MSESSTKRWESEATVEESSSVDSFESAHRLALSSTDSDQRSERVAKLREHKLQVYKRETASTLTGRMVSERNGLSNSVTHEVESSLALPNRKQNPLFDDVARGVVGELDTASEGARSAIVRPSSDTRTHYDTQVMLEKRAPSPPSLRTMVKVGDRAENPPIGSRGLSSEQVSAELKSSQ